MKKVWILNHYAITPDMGGITRHYDYAEELVKRGYDVTIFASSFDHKLRVEKLQENEKFRIENVNGVKFVWIKTFPYKKNDIKRVINILSFAIKLYKVGKLQEKPDIIIASSFHPLTCISGYYLSKNKKARYISEIRDLWPQSAIDMGAIKEGQLVTRILRRIEMFIYNHSEKIIVLLPGAVDYVESLGIPREKILYLPNGTAMDRYYDILKDENMNINNSIADIFNEHRDKFKALYLGALGRANAMDIIVDAAKILKEKGYYDIHILIVGDGPEKERLIEKSKSYDLGNIFFYPPVKKYDVPIILNGVDINLVSMLDIDVYKYGISLNKIFDYLCSGKPVVFAGNVMNDIVSNANAGISIQPENPQAFAEAIIKLYENSKGTKYDYGSNGKKYMMENHDIKVLASKLEKIL